MMHCRADGYPTPVVEWIFNGAQLSSSSSVSVQDGTLTVRHVGEEHSGVYQCLARSSMSGTDVSVVTAGVSLVVTASAHTHSQQSLNLQHAGGYSLGIHTQLHALMRYRCSARVGSGVVRIDPLRFLTGCRKRRLNQALSVPSLSLGFLSVSVVLLN